MGFRQVLRGVSEGYWECHKVLGAQMGAGGVLSVFMGSSECSRVSQGSWGRLRVLEGWNPEYAGGSGGCRGDAEGSQGLGGRGERDGGIRRGRSPCPGLKCVLAVPGVPELRGLLGVSEPPEGVVSARRLKAARGRAGPRRKQEAAGRPGPAPRPASIAGGRSPEPGGGAGQSPG